MSQALRDALYRDTLAVRSALVEAVRRDASRATTLRSVASDVESTVKAALADGGADALRSARRVLRSIRGQLDPTSQGLGQPPTAEEVEAVREANRTRLGLAGYDAKLDTAEPAAPAGPWAKPNGPWGLPPVGMGAGPLPFVDAARSVMGGGSLVNAAVKKITIRSQLTPEVSFVPGGAGQPDRIEKQPGFGAWLLNLLKLSVEVETPAGVVTSEPYGKPTANYFVPATVVAVAGAVTVGWLTYRGVKSLVRG